jgi:hypothetical protein
MSWAVPTLLAPTNVRSPHTRITVSQVLHASAAVAESADIVANAEPIARVLNMFLSLSESKERDAPWPFWQSIRVAVFGL